MATIEITCKVDVPADANYEETLAWVKFCLHQIGGLKNTNPLVEYDLDAYGISISEV